MLVTYDDGLGDNPLITALLAFEYPRECTLNYSWELKWGLQKLAREKPLEFLLAGIV